MIIVPTYAAIFAFLFVFLSFRVIKARRQEKIAIGAGGSAVVERAMRVHANFAEYVPFALLLLSFIEQKGAHYLYVNFLCLLLLVGRSVHIFGVSNENENFRYRVLGMSMTFATIIFAAITLLLMAIMR
jgi:uncharacterized membrane protein YecN with MAPEG domain